MPDLDNVDLAWQPEPLHHDWPDGLDNEFTMGRMEEAFIDQAKDGPGGRLLDIACGHARHCKELRAHGWTFIGIEPSPEMVRRARDYTAAEGEPAEMMRGIGELLPYKDETFDRILCMSSLDHFANPDVGMREMARVLKPNGRIVIGLVNYAGVSCNGSRLLYKIGRRIGTIPKGKRMFWDDPTDGEHTFEGKTRTLKKFAAGSLVLEKEYGASMMWAFPGWKYVFYPFRGRLRPQRIARNVILRGADRIGRAFPTVSDFVVTTWRKP
jgi:SAM-dependent methyltransferase